MAVTGRKQMPPAKNEYDEILKRHKSEFDARVSALEDNIDLLENKIHEQKPVEITSIIERLELIEEKLGVRFDGVYGVCVKRSFEDPEDFLIEVNFDVIGTEETLKRSFSPTLSAYNLAGQLLNTETSFIHNVNFLGIQSIKIQLLCSESPVRLRLYPAKPI